MGRNDRFEVGTSTTGSTPALYVVIRDEIIRAIQAGTYPPGSLLPSNSQIQDRWSVSHRISRRVLGELAEMGWARPEGTRGYIATAGPAPRRDADPDPTGPDPEPEPGPVPSLAPPAYTPPRPTHTVPLGSGIPEQFTTPTSIQAGIEPAPPEAAFALRLHGPGTPIHVRRRVFTDAATAVPLEIRTSYTIHVTDDSALAKPEPVPGPWAQALRDHTVHDITTASSTIGARHPTAYEAATLRIPANGIVLTRATTYHSRLGPPMDHTISVWPADSTTIHAADHPTT